MKDTLTMTKKRSSLLIGIAILLICVLAFGVAITLAPANTANAADYSYDPAVNGSSWDDETGLTVCFTCTDNGLTMYNWTLFLFDPSSFSNIDYEDSHKLTNSGSMNQNNASYCFNSEYDESQYTGVITIVWDKETQALGKSDTLESVWAQKDWRVVIGPHHTWQGNESYNCDYYVGEATTIARVSSAVPNFEGKDTLMNGETAEYTGSIYVSNGSSSNPGIIEYNYDQGQNSIQYRNKIEDANNPDNGNFKYSFGGDECFIIPSDGSDDLPRGIKIVDGDGTQENPYVFEGVYPAGLEFTTAVAGETVRYVDNANIGDTVVVTYKVTHNTGVNSLLLIPEFDSTVFAIDQISVNEETSLGEATVTGNDGVKKILLENTGAKYNALDGEEEFFLT
ncbi:MAG TPA: hypothetical protein DCG79_00060, partial [Clostridiales bacterium]|nr:hypothetical protein [Clostridiales bacterium]